MFEERIAAMNQRTEEAMAANAVQFDTIACPGGSFKSSE